MNCKQTKILYHGLKNRQLKIDKKILYMDSLLNTLIDADRINNLNNELTAIRDIQRQLIIDIDKLEKRYTFLKARG